MLHVRKRHVRARDVSGPAALENAFQVRSAAGDRPRQDRRHSKKNIYLVGARQTR
jgi:hypothetical protein